MEGFFFYMPTKKQIIEEIYWERFEIANESSPPKRKTMRRKLAKLKKQLKTLEK